MYKTKKIGNVTINYAEGSDKVVYADGAEKDLLELFSAKDADQKRKAILSDNPSWPMVYHLSNKRSTLTDWYDFKPGAKVLEVGAGCGAITEALIRKDINVTALEIDPVRAEVNAERNKSAKNLEIIVENLQTFTRPENEKFDYIVCVGVLEYSGKYIDAENPYLEFLITLRSLLKPSGKLLLAIENKLGLKYLAGAPEDHTGIAFDSLNNYPNTIGIKTFSKAELKDLLFQSGLKKSRFFYPHPDYKLPSHIFSDEVYPGNNIESPMSLFPTPTPESRLHLYSEQAVMLTLEKEKLYPYFANSFLVEATAETLTDSVQALAYVGQNDRKKEFAIGTVFNRSNGEIVVGKINLDPAGAQHVKGLKANYEILSKTFTNQSFKVLPVRLGKLTTGNQAMIYPMINAVTLERKLLLAVLSGDETTAISILKNVINLIDSFKSNTVNPTKNKMFVKVFGNTYDKEIDCVNPAVIDLNLDNIFDTKDGLTLIDYEWVFDFNVPKEFILGRLLLSFFANKYSDLIMRNYESVPLITLQNIITIPEFLVKEFDLENINYKTCITADLGFQNYVSSIAIVRTKSKPDKSEVANDNYVSFKEKFSETVNKKNEFEQYIKKLEKDISILNDDINRLNKERQELMSLRTVRLISKAHKKIHRK